MYIPIAIAATLSFAILAHAQGQNSSALISALQSAGLTRLAEALQSVNSTQTGQTIVNQLSNSTANYTVFAPNNAAFDAPEVSSSSNDPESLASILAYHVLPGYFVNNTINASALDSGTLPVVTLGRTSLNNQSLVHLEGDKSQVLAWTKNDTSPNSTIYFLNQNPQVTVLNTTGFGNILLAEVSGVLVPPGNLSSVAQKNNLTGVAGLIDMINVPGFFPNGSNATVEQILDANSTHGFTLFAPTNEALSAAGSSLSSFSNNQTALLALLGNHLINGTSYYSPQLLGTQNSSNFTSASGQPFSFSTNSSGSFVTSGNGASAKIVKTDLLVDNGVVHVVDNVLINLNRDESKASSAYASATSVAGQSTTQTGPIGPTSALSSAGANNGNHASGAAPCVRAPPFVLVWTAFVVGSAAAFGARLMD